MLALWLSRPRERGDNPDPQTTRVGHLFRSPLVCYRAQYPPCAPAVCPLRPRHEECLPGMLVAVLVAFVTLSV